MSLLYDPPAGWRYGFPKPYRPLPGETLAETLRRDGYPQHEIDNGGARYCRFIGQREEPKEHTCDDTAGKTCGDTAEKDCDDTYKCYEDCVDGERCMRDDCEHCRGCCGCEGCGFDCGCLCS